MANRDITLTIIDGDDSVVKQVPIGTRLLEILPKTAANGLPVLAAIANNDLISLFTPAVIDAEIKPLTIADDYGWRIYRWSLCFVIAKAAHDVCPKANVRIRHSVGDSLFYSIDAADKKEKNSLIKKLAKRMREIVDADYPIEYQLQGYGEVTRRLEETGQTDKLYLLSHRNPPAVPIVDCDGFPDLFQEPFVSRTGLLTTFELEPFKTGFLLRLPIRKPPFSLAPAEERKGLFQSYTEHEFLAKSLGFSTVGELNQLVIKRKANEIIRICETRHENRFAEIAKQIASRPVPPKLILIAGPSSSGKTTSALRLMTQLSVYGFRPFVISTDDYFVGDERNPRDENGNLDYEHIEAVDLPRLNHDLKELFDGNEVTMPYFDFVQHRPFDRKEKTHLEEDQVVIMEGIHSLNPRLTSDIDDSVKFHIFVSAMTQIAIDNTCRVASSDNRLIRRMVRDSIYRGRTAEGTLKMWPSVRRGEERWIFPFQDRADAVFNSALDYELGVLKSYAADLLNSVKPTMPEYTEARRLGALLKNFIAISPDAIPGDSILRECIGGSQLEY